MDVIHHLGGLSHHNYSLLLFPLLASSPEIKAHLKSVFKALHRIVAVWEIISLNILWDHLERSVCSLRWTYLQLWMWKNTQFFWQDISVTGHFLTIFKKVVLLYRNVWKWGTLPERKDQKERYSRFCTRLVRVLNSDPEAVTLVSYRALGNLPHPTAAPRFISFFAHEMKIMLTYLLRQLCKFSVMFKIFQ